MEERKTMVGNKQMEDLTRGKSEPEGRSVFVVCRISLVLY